jgi:hypothetical protein
MHLAWSLVSTKVTVAPEEADYGRSVCSAAAASPGVIYL